MCLSHEISAAIDEALRYLLVTVSQEFYPQIISATCFLQDNWAVEPARSMNIGFEARGFRDHFAGVAGRETVSESSEVQHYLVSYFGLRRRPRRLS